ncbi:MAG: hypothetical protein QGI60_00480 [archaeon]|nr:hypothetical protein [archaeon]
MASNSVKPESLLHFPQAQLSPKESKIYDFVLETWPTSAIEIAEHFKEDTNSRESKKKASTKYTYYLKKLVEKGLLLSKRMGNALVVWPMKAERLRAVHAILEGKVN